MIAARSILICNERFLPRFGHDRSLVLLARMLASRGHHVSFACLRCERQLLAAISGNINELSLVGGTEFAAADKLAAEKVEATWAHNRPDVLITGGWPFFELAARSAAHRVRSLLIDAGAVPHDGYEEPDLTTQREVRRLRQRTLPFIDRILTNSDFTRDSQTIPDRGHHRGVTSVLLGADHMEMRFDPANIDFGAENNLLARVDSMCGDGAPLILALGRFKAQGYKNSPMVFDVFRRVLAEVPGACLMILAGPRLVAVPADVAASVICAETLSDAVLQEVMHRASLGLSLSLWEGFNLPLAEMQLLNKPVLVFNIGAHSEIVTDPWFLCSSSAEMGRKAVKILTLGVPSPITTRGRFARTNEHLRWANTFAHWTAAIEELAATPVSGMPTSRRLVLMDITNSAKDPANSGVINVTRHLASKLMNDPKLFVVFGIWAGGNYILPSSWDRSLLESYSGPKDWLGRLIERLGRHLPLERVLEAADPRCARPPVLFLPEVMLGNDTALRRVDWARAKGFRVAFLLHDLLPVYEAKYVASGMVELFPQYLTAVMQADAIWANSSFTLSAFERYCGENGANVSSQREAIWLPGQFADTPRLPGSAPDTEEVRILCVSTIEPRKNHRGLIQAFEYLLARCPDVALRLVLVGNGYVGAEDLADWVQQVARRNDRIEWRGALSQTELEREFIRATFTVYPSLAEGFGLPILESLWMGRPCICHEGGVMGELAAGGGCVAVDVRDPTELSFAMEQLCSDSALIDALRRQATAREITDWSAYSDAIARRLADVC